MEISYEICPKICLFPVEDGITEFRIKPSYCSEDSEEYVSAGDGSGYIFENPFDSDQLRDMLDMVNSDTYALCDVLTETETGQELLDETLKIVYIHTYELKPEFRGKGIGLYTMKFIIELFSGSNLILLHPSPLNKNKASIDYESARKKLGDHWAKVGFKRIENSNVFYIL